MVISLKKIQGTYENIIVIQKSEFITRLFRVNTIEEVNFHLDEIRKKHYDATHNCYAYILGNTQEIQKCSDDGEPQKTAGAPMIDVLKKNNITDILAITTRYFGGILLGAGGLVRAYSSSVSECLKHAQFYEVKKQIKSILTTDYSGYNIVLKNIPYVQIIETSFTDFVTMILVCDIEAQMRLSSDLIKYKISTITFAEVGEVEIEIPAGS